MEQIRAVVDEEGLDALGKLNRVYEASRKWQATNLELVMTIVKAMYQDENLLLRHKIEMRSLVLCIPVFSRIIAQGAREGIFDVSSPEDMSEMILRIGNNLSDSTTRLFLEADEKPENLEIIERKIILYEQAVERILGAPKGSIHVLDKGFLRDFTKRYYSKPGKKKEQFAEAGH